MQVPGLSPQDPIRIVLADDHTIVREALATLLESVPGFEVVAQASSGEELLRVIDFQRPDIVLTDVSMPGLDGIEALARLRERHPGLPVVVLSMLDGVDVIKRAVASGARGYLLKNASRQELEHAVRTVTASGQYFSPAIAAILLRKDSDGPSQLLTERQIEILRLIATGHSSKEIGFQLGLSSKTVDVHRAHIMQRLDIHDIASLTRYALKNGVVRDSSD
ncbi:MAG: response regulator transcription factor [Burkholderiales bacterium]|nr:response regulator transcription factor [Burkholderiales bacterium]